MPARSRPSPSCRRFANGSTDRWRCPARSPRAARSWRLRRWAPTSPISAPPFIATEEARASEAYKQAIVDGVAEDIVGSSLFTGVYGNYLRPSIVADGMDPDNLPQGDVKTMNFSTGEGSKAKAWRDIWGSGQGIGAVKSVRPAAEFIADLKRQYDARRARRLL